MKISASWRWTRSALGLARNKWLNLLHEAKKKGGSLYPTFLWRKTMLLFDDDSCSIMRQMSWNPMESIPLSIIPRPTGGGLFRAPPLVFLRYLLNQCRYHHQTCSTLSPNNFTHCVKILKVQGIIVWPQMTSEWRHVPPISTENKGLRESPPRVQF